ncbi:response regulator [Candidatus Azambacteria bacterium]|nr:response regulator [Candidatus Azambacteria bacterium]
MPKSEKKKILVVEDEATLNQIYQNKLESSGYEVVSAYDGEDAIIKAGETMPDLVLLDLMLPKKSGYDVLTEMKKDEKIKDIPVMILSNLGQEEDVKRGISLGAVDFVTKSNIKLADLMKKIEEVFKNKN